MDKMSLSSALISHSYTKLLKILQKEIASSQNRIQRYVDTQRIRTYWSVGRHIAVHLLDKNFETQFGSNLFGRLAGDLQVNERLLHQCAQFYRFYPSLPKFNGLTWTHYTLLLRIPDQKERLKWERRIESERISSGRFKMLMHDLIGQRKEPSWMENGKIKEERGRLYMYRMIQPDDVHVEDPQPVIDCGFDIFVDQPPDTTQTFHAGDLIASVKEDGRYRIKFVQEERKKLYTYQAFIEKVVDGDTLRVKVDCGFGIRVRQYLRLRGIDCPELSTLEGRKARKFVQERLADVPFVIIKTYNSDKYDRYLVDVFYEPSAVSGSTIAHHPERKSRDPQLSAADSWKLKPESWKFLNQDLLDEKLAALWQPE
ncbi:MAG: hypothetical protein A2Z88_09245 [Omnitrophica WOR_2 bacterium GWA2_47_8]|nr:MAG: hypothetical protein A2Z88_09245 [Omnitrophica WOR_2 bacterium GWA2_47_8]